MPVRVKLKSFCSTLKFY